MSTRNWLLGIVASVLLLTAFAPRNRLIGLSYSVAIDNAVQECPDTVVRVDGTRVTLDDGRIFDITGPPAADLSALLTDARYRVRVDPSDRTFNVLQRIGFCGFDFPQHNRLITIPLLRNDLPAYGSRTVGEAKAVIKRP